MTSHIIEELEKKVTRMEEMVEDYLLKETDEFLTRKEVAKLSKSSERTIADNQKFQKIECRISKRGKVLYPRADVINIIKGIKNVQD